MSGDNLFTPKPAGTVNIAATSSSARVSLARLGCRQVRIKNLDATAAAFVNFGDVTVTVATTTGMPIGAGETVGITLAEDWTYAAAICATTATVYFTPGNGL